MQSPVSPLRGLWPARLAAGVLLLLGFIPWTAFWRSDLEVPQLDAQLKDWGTGAILTLGVALLAWLASRRGYWPSPRTTLSSRHDAAPGVEVPTRTLPNAVYLVALCSFILYAIVASAVLSRHPLLVDEVAQLWQAQRYAEGMLSVPVPTHREFFSIFNVVDIGDRVYSQFPPGGPLMLVPGVLVGNAWLIGPLCGALMVVLFARVARGATPDASQRWVTGAALLFAVTPFLVFMFASHMNHVTALLWILVTTIALSALQDSAPRSRASRRVWAVVLGFGLGAAATIRPLDAFAYALPAALWLVVRARKSVDRWTEAVLAGVGVAVPFAAMMYVNTQTVGHPLRFGYEVLWGAAHGLGFHAAPWGVPHTPLRGFLLASLYQWRLQSHLFETIIPSLVFPVAGLWFGHRALGVLDKYLLASGALVVLFYGLYWFDGYYLGPRFIIPLVPVLVLWTARLPLIIDARLPDLHGRRALKTALVFSVLGAAVFNLPVRIARYHAFMPSMRLDYARYAEQAGVRNALVFVRESWGAQLIARLWALGVSRPMTEAVYRGTDACHLEETLTTLERQGVRDHEAEARLAFVLGTDSSFVVRSTLSPDVTEGMRPGARYTDTCLQRINDDRAGFLHYLPLRLVTTGGNVYARDLHARDSLLLAEYPGRPVYLLTGVGVHAYDALRFVPMGRDSLMVAWRAGR